MNDKFRGIFSALLTAFNALGDFSEAAQRAMIQKELDEGLRGFYVGGSTGEAFLLTPEERKALYRVSAEAAAGKTTLIGHVGAISLREAADYAKTCEALGYDAISSVTPFYYKFSAEEIIRYYRALADAVGIPLVLYHIPLLTGSGYGMELFDALLEDPRMKTPQSRYLVREELDALIAEWTGRHTKQEAMDILCRADIPAGAVLDMDDLTNDPYLRSRGTMVEIEHPERGKLVVPGFAPKMSGNELEYKCSPKLGEHNGKVYQGLLGLTDAEMAELKEKGVI